MIYTLSKIIITALIIVTVSEVSKRNSLFGALFASLPLTSVLAMVWLYSETKEVDKVADLANSIFWLVIPSLVFFISLPILLKKGLNFYLSMGLSITMTVVCYVGLITLLTRLGIKL
ncbi:MAG: DUF3147 family protein [Methylococcales bacterium]|nr:DUF3147 family protein [Methylococcales bacterium]